MSRRFPIPSPLATVVGGESNTLFVTHPVQLPNRLSLRLHHSPARWSLPRRCASSGSSPVCCVLFSSFSSRSLSTLFSYSSVLSASTVFTSSTCQSRPARSRTTSVHKGHQNMRIRGQQWHRKQRERLKRSRVLFGAEAAVAGLLHRLGKLHCRQVALQVKQSQPHRATTAPRSQTLHLWKPLEKSPGPAVQTASGKQSRVIAVASSGANAF